MPPASRRFYFLGSASLILISLLIYAGVGDHELLNWDDRSYTVANPWVTNPTFQNLLSMFTEVRMGNWHPLTWLSFVPEYAICGDGALCYKLTNALLHGINAFLLGVFVIVLLGLVELRLELPAATLQLIRSSRAGLSFSQWVGLLSSLLFLAHPQHVEAVTWVAERKELLCGLFYLSALIVYCRGYEWSYWRRNGAVLTLFILALMSKSMAVSLPLALVLLDVFLLHHQKLLREKDAAFAFSTLVIQKLPYFLLMFGAMLLTVISQTPGRLQPVALDEKLFTVLAGLQHYPLKFLLPVGFSPFYPQELVYSGMIGYLPLLIFAGGTAFVFYKCRGSWSLPLLLLALLFYLVAVAPVIGIVKVGEQAFADRYSYLPTIGFYLIAGWCLAWLAFRVSRLVMVLAPLCLLVIFLGLQSYAYKGVWRNDLVFWSTVVDSYPDVAATPLDNLANSLSQAGEYQLALDYYERSIAVNPQGLMAYLNLASVYDFLGESDAALNTLAAGVAANPDSAGLQSRAGKAFLLAGDLQQAGAYIENAQRLQPDLADVQLSRGMLDLMRGDVTSAIGFLAAVPGNMPQHYEAGLLLVQAQAQQDLDQAKATLGDLIARYGERPQLQELRESLESGDLQ